MKTYRIQARAFGKYLNDIIKAENSLDALNEFSKKVNEGQVKIIDEDFYNKKITFITYEELYESGKNKTVE